MSDGRLWEVRCLGAAVGLHDTLAEAWAAVRDEPQFEIIGRCTLFRREKDRLEPMLVNVVIKKDHLGNWSATRT